MNFRARKFTFTIEFDTLRDSRAHRFRKQIHIYKSRKKRDRYKYVKQRRIKIIPTDDIFVLYCAAHGVDDDTKQQ